MICKLEATEKPQPEATQTHTISLPTLLAEKTHGHMVFKTLSGVSLEGFMSLISTKYTIFNERKMVTSLLAEFYGSLDLAIQLGQLFSGCLKKPLFWPFSLSHLHNEMVIKKWILFVLLSPPEDLTFWGSLFSSVLHIWPYLSKACWVSTLSQVSYWFLTLSATCIS